MAVKLEMTEGLRSALAELRASRKALRSAKDDLVEIELLLAEAIGCSVGVAQRVPAAGDSQLLRDAQVSPEASGGPASGEDDES